MKVLSNVSSDVLSLSKDRVEINLYTLYILRTSSNTLYIGQTNDINRRLLEHKSKSSKSAKYIKQFDLFELVYIELYQTRKESMKREKQLKTWSRVKKEALIHNNIVALKKL